MATTERNEKENILMRECMREFVKHGDIAEMGIRFGESELLLIRDKDREEKSLEDINAVGFDVSDNGDDKDIPAAKTYGKITKIY